MDSGSPAISSMAEEREESMEDVRREGMSSSAEIWYSGGSERARRCSCSVNSAIVAAINGDEKRRMFMAFEVRFQLFCFVYRRVAKEAASKKKTRNQIILNVWRPEPVNHAHIRNCNCILYKHYCNVLLQGISLVHATIPI